MRLVGGGIDFNIGGGARIGGGGGTFPLPTPGITSFISSSGSKSVKSRSHSVNCRTMLFLISSQCNSFSDFFGSAFLIS